MPLNLRGGEVGDLLQLKWPSGVGVTSIVLGMELMEVQERKPQRKTRGKPNAVDIHVGNRVRQRRTLMGLSQERLAAALDLTFQ